MNKEENKAVWRNFNEALDKLNKRLDESQKETVEDHLAAIFTDEGASFITEKIREAIRNTRGFSC